MNNIFENAYFGKPYKTRDGRKARFVINMGEHYGHPYRLVIEGADNFFNYDEYGMMTNIERNYDIVSEWTIDEEELDRLAKESELVKLVPIGHDLERKWAINNFKAGFRTKEKYDIQRIS